MTKKRLALIAVLPLLTAAMIGVLTVLPPTPGFTKANFHRIQEGMTRAEVVSIFGQDGEMCWYCHQKKDGDFTLYFQMKNKASSRILFEDFRVNEMHWHSHNDIPETMLNKFRRWLHLP